MAFLIKLLGAGATPNPGSITAYLVPASASGAIVSNVRLVNTTGGAVLANVSYVPSGSAAVRISDKDKSMAAGDILTVKPELTMGAGDAISVSTSAAIDYVVSGVERV